MENCLYSLIYAFSGPKRIYLCEPVSYRKSAFWGRCPALTPLLQLITSCRTSGTADHVRSLDVLLRFLLSITGRICQCFTDRVTEMICSMVALTAVP